MSSRQQCISSKRKQVGWYNQNERLSRRKQWRWITRKKDESDKNQDHEKEKMKRGSRNQERRKGGRSLCHWTGKFCQYTDEKQNRRKLEDWTLKIIWS